MKWMLAGLLSAVLLLGMWAAVKGNSGRTEQGGGETGRYHRLRRI